jgi:hypothetical protein
MEGNGMTTEVDADYFRTHWMKCSASCKSQETASSARLGKPVDDVHYAELLARIERLHASFDAWCGGMAAEHANVRPEQDISRNDGTMPNRT